MDPKGKKMTTETAVISFVLGFLRAAVLTFVISIACYWGYDLAAILIVGAVGGVMTMKSVEEKHK